MGTVGYNEMFPTVPGGTVGNSPVGVIIGTVGHIKSSSTVGDYKTPVGTHMTPVGTHETPVGDRQHHVPWVTYRGGIRNSRGGTRNSRGDIPSPVGTPLIPWRTSPVGNL